MSVRKPATPTIGFLGENVLDIYIEAPSRIVRKRSGLRTVEYLGYEYGAKLPVDSLLQTLGGCAANAATSVARLGVSAHFFGTIGDRDFFRQVQLSMQKEGIDTRFLSQSTGGEKNLSFILMGPTHDRSILVHRAKRVFDKKKFQNFIRSVQALYVADITDSTDVALDMAIRSHRKNGLRIFFNPSHFQLRPDYKNRLREILQYTEILAVNDSEARKIVSGSAKDVPAIITQLHRLGPKIVLVTQGPKGAYLSDGSTIYRTGIWDVEVKDRTGSGDAFFSTFVASYLTGATMQEAGVSATINASHVASEYGAQTGLLSLAQLKKMIKKHVVPVTRIQ